MQALAAADTTGNQLLDALNSKMMHGAMSARNAQHDSDGGADSSRREHFAARADGSLSNRDFVAISGAEVENYETEQTENF